MEKELFIARCDQLKNKVPELRWIDSDQEIGRAHV